MMNPDDYTREKRALERRVAREIFAQTVIEGEGTHPDYTIETTGERVGRHLPIPHYRSDLTAAWRIVERMRERGYTVTITAEPSGDWLVVMKRRWRSWQGNAVTAAWAICLAALATPEEAMDNG